MRLLYYTSAGELCWTEDLIGNDPIPSYAILSHTWIDGEEVTYDDLVKDSGKSKAGYKKIEFCASQAKKDNLDHFWIDTCCINKSNSTELSEAIISMFRWYKNAERCYVYLSDISSEGYDGSGEVRSKQKPDIGKSRWFTRGWTLQELIAPASVEFFSKESSSLGDKQSLVHALHSITGIAVEALKGRPLASFPVDERMSWSGTRNTKREEDAAYSLLGIFDVQMTPLYGERRQKAMHRLQREIRKKYSVKLPIATGASYDSYIEEHNPRCLPNTRTELLQEIAGWAQDRNSKPILWLSGMAGTGKSTVARTVAESFASNGQLGASFFFKKGEGERSNASRFFTTIANDLAACELGMVPLLKQALDKDPGIPHRTLKDQFEKLILRPLAGIKQTLSKASVLVVVVDALDECEREQDDRAILQLLSLAKDIRPLSLRIIVTSRPELHIRLGFQEMSDGTYKDFTLHKVPRSTIEHDIRLFLEHELGKIRRTRMLSEDWPTPEQFLALVDLVVPLFIYAATVCRYIGTKGGNPKKNLNKVLDSQKSAFSKLDLTYFSVLDQLLEEQEHDEKEERLEAFREVVGSIAILKSPLPVSQLASLLRISREEVRWQLDSLHSVLSIPDSDHIPIRILHLSFRDFLVDPHKQGKSPFCVEERSAHKKLASCCLELMSGPSGLRQSIRNIGKREAESDALVDEDEEVDENEEEGVLSTVLPRVAYACHCWVHHLQQSQQSIVDGDTTHLFLQKHLLDWLEAMSYLEASNACFDLLDSLQALVSVSESNVSTILHDATRFLQRFKSIMSESPSTAQILAQIVRKEGTATAQVVAALNVRTRWGTSGIPDEDGLTDFLGLFRFLHFVPYDESKTSDEEISQLRRDKRMEEAASTFQEMLSSFMLRRTKAIPDLPPRTDEIVHITFDEREKEYYRQEEQSLVKLQDDAPGNSSYNVNEHIYTLCDICTLGIHQDTPQLTPTRDSSSSMGFTDDDSKISSKIRKLVEQIKTYPAEKNVVFSSWTSSLKMVEQGLSAQNIAFVRIDSNAFLKYRAHAMGQFRNDSKVRVALVPLSCSNIGLDLTVASRVHLLEPLWNPSLEGRAITAVYRLGQMHPVTIIRYIIRDSIEEEIMQVQDRKYLSISALLSGTSVIEEASTEYSQTGAKQDKPDTISNAAGCLLTVHLLC